MTLQVWKRHPMDNKTLEVIHLLPCGRFEINDRVLFVYADRLDGQPFMVINDWSFMDVLNGDRP